MEDDLTVEEMRKKPERDSRRRTFMAPGELVHIRTTVLMVSQGRLSEQLIHPDSGEPVKQGTVSFWESGRRAIPLWAARKVRELAEAAKRYDAKRTS